MYDFGLTDDQFWALTPPQFSALSRRHEQTSKVHDAHTAKVCWAVFTAAGGKKESGGRLAPLDFMPKYGDDGEEEIPDSGAESMSPNAILEYLKAAFPPREVKEEHGG